ncbi:Ni/Fe hydrogenase [Erythrobacter sp. QSSC1-22B]|uniref:HupE/UreJ family protein n=1 Tax=Erythrobacter sp. QSSC1-22B TaxID=1860125 RepID=UPI0008048E52|nr:HupE/UreJ family protein [Erythrobacter sp. QSSC1-22B]OBX19813.1 Ni/Fe hydrogenase [Erythrobacter sp. QSSC1-22B]
MSLPNCRLTVALGAALLAWHSPAMAHESDSLMLGFVGGFLHPLAGADHLLAMVAVGIWGAFLGRPLVYLLPMAFPVMMALGGVAAMAGLPLPPVEIGIALSVLVLGAAILFAYRAPVWLAVIIVAIFGLFHGYAHGLELPSMANPISFSLGFVLSTGLLHICGIALGLLRGSSVGSRLLRGTGGLIALAGFWFFYWAVR